MITRPLTITLTDEVNCVISGLREEHLKFFGESYAILTPNYFFHPKVKLGVWDGKLRFFGQQGKTYINLLDEIIPTLVKLHYAPKIVDNRKKYDFEFDHIDENYFSHILHTHTGEPTVLRNHQVEAVNCGLDNGGGIIVASTGSGKTLLNAALVDMYGRKGLKTITIVPSQDLIMQTKRQFEHNRLDTGEYSGDCKDLDHNHIVSTWQALKNNPSILNAFQVVVVDECHLAKARILKTLLIEHGSHIPYRFGLTGSLPKEKADAMTIRTALGSIIYTIDAHTLIGQKHLAELAIEMIELQEDLSDKYTEFLADNPTEKMTYKQFKDSYFPDYQSEKNYLQKAPDRLQAIVDIILSTSEQKKGNIFCLVGSIGAGKKLSSMVPNSHFVYGKDEKEARKEIYDLFNDNDNVVVFATINVASTGLDIPRIFYLALIDLGKSFVRTIQSIGRGLRRAKDKDKVIVLDICSDLKYSRKHQRDRIKYYNEAKYPHKKRSIDLKLLSNNENLVTID